MFTRRLRLIRLCLGGAVWGSLLGIVLGTFLGMVYGAIAGDVSLGLDGAVFGCLGLGPLGAGYGCFLARKQHAGRARLQPSRAGEPGSAGASPSPHAPAGCYLPEH